MNILVFNNKLRLFLIHELSKRCSQPFKKWLLKLDNGHYDEISSWPDRQANEWILYENNLEIEKIVEDLVPRVDVYDIQTRPILSINIILDACKFHDYSKFLTVILVFRT